MSTGRFYVLSVSAIIITVTLSSCRNNCKHYIHKCAAIEQTVLDVFPYDSGAVVTYQNELATATLKITSSKASEPYSIKPCRPDPILPGCYCNGGCSSKVKFTGSFNRYISTTDSNFSVEFKENLSFEDGMDTTKL